MQPPLLFLSAKEKEERPAGVEEKEGFAPSCCPAPPTGAEHLSCTFHFSCGLCPKDAAAGKSCASILWHLSGRIQYLPHPLAAAALMRKRIRKQFQIALRSVIKCLSIRSSPKHRKAAASPLFLCTVHGTFLFLAEKKKCGVQTDSRPRSGRKKFYVFYKRNKKSPRHRRVSVKQLILRMA